MAPNLLFIFSDQHARHVTGCYGDKLVKTPNLDRLASEGVRFTNAYCPSPICVPSRMSMLTARWPHRQRCWTNDDILTSAIPTWLHAAGAAGRRPVLIGRLHAMGPDQRHGYAEREVGEHSPNWPGVPRHGMGVLEGANDPSQESLEATGAGRSAYQEKDEVVTEAAVRWLEEEAPRTVEGGQPFCLTVGLMLPHAPYVVDREAFAHYEARVPPPRLAPGDHPFHLWWREDRGVAALAERQAQRARAAYWGLVHRMDEMIGRILGALERTGLLDDTLIVYASDHGDHVGERGLWWKHTFFEESVAVPLLMRLPGTLPAGETRSAIVNLVDLSQTMLEAIGAPRLPNADGRSFWKTACDGSVPFSGETFSEYCTDPVPHWTGGRAVQQRMIRSGPYKLALYDAEPVQLFDLEEDPDETNDLAASPRYESVREALLSRLTHDWTPHDIARTMRAQRLEKDIIAAWARQIVPQSSDIWVFDPSVNRLDG